MKIISKGFILLLFCSQLSAVRLSHDNAGEVLIFPYYTVNGGYNTLLNISNTTDQSKALRVRFREAANGREVFAFNLYLGPKDVWVGALVKGNAEQQYVTQLVTSDQSCSVPVLNKVPENNPFYAFNFNNELQDVYGTDIKRMHEGFIEVIEMGVVTGDSAIATVIPHSDSNLNCLSLHNAWYGNLENNYWAMDRSIDMQPPSGGIAGHVILLDVEQGISVTQEPTVINDFSDDVLHYSVGSDSPSLADGKTTSVIEHDGKKISLEWATGFEALSSVLMTNEISNEYALNDEIDAKTDWIMTMPTAHFHTDPLYLESNEAVKPFLNTSAEGLSCETFNKPLLYDRNQMPSDPFPDICSFILCPPSAIERDPVMCYATTNLNFSLDEDQEDLSFSQGQFVSNYSPLMEKENQLNKYNINSPFASGWTKLEFEQSSVTIDENIALIGLPIIGFTVQKYSNANAQPGRLAQYAGIFKHKQQVAIEYLEQTPEESLSPMTIAKNNVGQVLLYPYYTVRNDMNSLITVVNTTDQVKALKLKFLEGRNGREVLNFNLYLGAFDVWTAAVVETTSTESNVGDDFAGQISAKIITSDTSCTVPVINDQEFLPFAFSGIFNDGLIQSMERVTEGSIEIIEMGTVIGDDADAATHTSAGVPEDCQQLVGNWTPPSGQWIMDTSFNIVDPDGKGGLYGSMSLIDIESGIDMTYDATAIVNYSTNEQHSFPGDLFPNLATGNITTTLIETNEGVFETDWDDPGFAMTALFMQAQISNDYVIDELIGAETEWVNSFPTKTFHVDPLNSLGVVPVAPFSLALNTFGACESHRFKSFNREQQINSQMSGIFPLDPPPPNLSFFPQNCWSVNVADVNKGDDVNSIFDSQLSLNDWNQDFTYSSIDTLSYESGIMMMDFDDVSHQETGHLTGQGKNGELHTIYGMPVLGFVAQKYVNGNAMPGLLANYGVINMNKNHKKIVVTEAQKGE